MKLKLKNYTKFKIKGLNQEKVLNEISRSLQLFEIERHSKNDTTFKCSYFDRKKTEKKLKEKNVEIVSVEHEGVVFKLKKMLTSYGTIVGVVLFFAFYFVQSQFIFQYEINGTNTLSKSEVVAFIQENFSKNKNVLDTEDIEIGLLDKFEQLSFASCIIKGQTLVVNVKEKLLPSQMYSEFKPLISQKDAKITQIDLISGTANVSVGDIVRAGDILVFPYTIDTSGSIKKVEAKATITAEVYNEGSANHYEQYVEVKRTGKTSVKNEILLFGLNIYTFDDGETFEKFEEETDEVSLAQNLFLPFKMRKTICYELCEELVESNFEDVKEEYVAKARENALENCENCDTIIEEYYTLRHLSGVTIVNYVIVTSEQIGGYQ